MESLSSVSDASAIWAIVYSEWYSDDYDDDESSIEIAVKLRSFTSLISSHRTIVHIIFLKKVVTAHRSIPQSCFPFFSWKQESVPCGASYWRMRRENRKDASQSLGMTGAFTVFLSQSFLSLRSIQGNHPHRTYLSSLISHCANHTEYRPTCSHTDQNPKILGDDDDNDDDTLVVRGCWPIPPPRALSESSLQGSD